MHRDDGAIHGAAPARRRPTVMAPHAVEAPSSEAGLLALARSLPCTGDRVLCSPNVLPPADIAAAIGREPHSSDIPGDYCYLALGAEWKRASKVLLAAAAAIYGGSAEVAADARNLRASMLTVAQQQRGGGGAVSAGARADEAALHALRGSFQTPPAPTGPHITIRSNLRPIVLLPSSDWRFRVKRVVAFTNPKIGKPSQWDSEWFCARWVALEVEWLGSCAEKQRGRWPHIAIASFGFRTRGTAAATAVPPMQQGRDHRRASSSGRSSASDDESSGTGGDGSGSKKRKKRRKRVELATQQGQEQAQEQAQEQEQEQEAAASSGVGAGKAAAAAPSKELRRRGKRRKGSHK